MNSNDSGSTKSPFLDWPAWAKGSVANPLDIFAAPQSLTQPILPGWVVGGVVNVTEQNSTAPDTEREILTRHSYGRQLGRILDALMVLVAEEEKRGVHAPAFDALRKVDDDVNYTKGQAAAGRIDRLIADLAWLRDNDQAAYDRVMASVRDHTGT